MKLTMRQPWLTMIQTKWKMLHLILTLQRITFALQNLTSTLHGMKSTMRQASVTMKHMKWKMLHFTSSLQHTKSVLQDFKPILQPHSFIPRFHPTASTVSNEGAKPLPAGRQASGFAPYGRRSPIHDVGEEELSKSSAQKTKRTCNPYGVVIFSSCIFYKRSTPTALTKSTLLRLRVGPRPGGIHRENHHLLPPRT